MADPPGPVKCLVWDLDNTLWQGTLLEDGEVPLAAGVREVVETLDARGILQSVASRNDRDLAEARLAALGLADYFLLPQIGWGRKSDAVRHVAERLGFAEGALAFLDDEPAERAEVAFHLPAVRCYSPAQLPGLLGLAEFNPTTVTADARRRRSMYRAGFAREVERDSYAGPDEDFLRSLDLRMVIGRAGGAELARVEELTRRTSQLNATGVPYPVEVLRELCADPGHEVLVATLTDRFGPYGAVGVVLLGTGPGRWHLKLLATSCRVIPVGAGTALLGWLVDRAARAGVHLVADLRRTGRNRMMEVAYRFAGFTDLPADGCGCLAGLPDGGPVQRLHLVPAPAGRPGPVRVDAPDLAAGR